MVDTGQLDSTEHQHMPYVVVAVSEYGDIMMSAGKTFEHPLYRLAQLSRAVGIHLVICTQRITNTIVNGNIRANFPCLIACQVMHASRSNSLIPGAEHLLLKGDALVLSGGNSIRVQTPYIDCDMNIHEICCQIASQKVFEGKYDLLRYEKPEMKKVEIGRLEVVFKAIT